MVVIITGAAGFIGSHLASRYLREGHDVVGIDDFSSSRRGSRHLRELESSSRFELVEGRLEDLGTINFAHNVCRNSERTLILNFACPASPPRYQEIPQKTLDTCYVGTKNVLNLARRLNARVVHASTSEIYGDPLKSPQNEFDWGNVNCFGPRSCYDEGKRIAETICYEAIKDDVDVRIVRIFNTFGPNMDPDDGRVVTNFIKQTLKGEQITIYGDGKQTRSFCYVDDLVEGVVRLAAKDRDREIQFPINLGNPEEFTMLQLAHRVVEVAWKLGNDKRPTLKFDPLPVDDPRQRKPCIERARSLLGWEPKISLYEGLRMTIEQFTK